MAYRRRNRIRREIQRLERLLAAVRSVDQQAGTPPSEHGEVSSGLSAHITRERVVATIFAMVVLFALARSVWAQPATPTRSDHHCAVETERAAHLVDLTGSRDEADRIADRQAVARALAMATPCSRHVVIGITADSWQSPRLLLDVRFPEDGWMNQVIRQTRRAAVARWIAASDAQPGGFDRTDVTGAFAYAAALLQISEARPAKILSYSDLRQTNLGFEGQPPPSPAAALRRATERGMVPDLRGAEVWLLSVSIDGISPASWTSLREFWTSWVAKTGARLRDYAIDRSPCASARCQPTTPTTPVVRATPVQAPVELLDGSVGSSLRAGSGWIQLNAVAGFERGDRLRFHVAGAATRMIVRLLSLHDDPNDPVGINGGTVQIPPDGIVEVVVERRFEAVTQISVHGGPSPFGLYPLGEENGSVHLLRVERVASGAR
jgi:hypothetical protein